MHLYEEAEKISLAGLEVYRFGFFVLLGMLAAAAGMGFLSWARRAKKGTAPLLLLTSLLLGGLFSRLFFCLLNQELGVMMPFGSWFAVTGGGWSMMGLVGGVLLAAWITAKITRQKAGLTLDLAACALPLFMGLERLGEGGVLPQGGLLPGFHHRVPDQKPASARGAPPPALRVGKNHSAVPAPAAENVVPQRRPKPVGGFLVDHAPVDRQGPLPRPPCPLAQAEEPPQPGIRRVPGQIQNRRGTEQVAGEGVGLVLQQPPLIRRKGVQVPVFKMPHQNMAELVQNGKADPVLAADRVVVGDEIAPAGAQAHRLFPHRVANEGVGVFLFRLGGPAHGHQPNIQILRQGGGIGRQKARLAGQEDLAGQAYRLAPALLLRKGNLCHGGPPPVPFDIASRRAS